MLPELFPHDDLSGLREIDERSDTANSVMLLMDPSDQLPVVSVVPTEDGQLPFSIKVKADQAAEAYLHPYAFLEQAIKAGSLATGQAVEMLTTD